ncbi:amine sulfotransferase-like isoform X3 [Ascaphus truei]|uniref:amine sulfotransferase-like isoform X3 n=1 Tax=Ascaphus truei TaxID=8439 RepID=UPI003F597817
MSQATSEPADPFMFKHRGIYFPTEFIVPEYIDSLEHFEIRESDVFLVTYPKSGTIWTQQIMSLIFNEGHRNGTESIDNNARVPWLEIKYPTMDYNSRPSPRLFTSHLPYFLMPNDLRNKKGKHLLIVVLTTRRCDVAEMRRCRRAVIYGSWFDHVTSWYANKKDFNILFMTYEEMIMDLRSSVLKICRFVGKELDEQALATVMEKATFKNMKHDPVANYTFIPDDVLNKKKGAFLRKGTIGDWKNILTVAQNERFDKVFLEKTNDLPLKLIWDIHEEK